MGETRLHRLDRVGREPEARKELAIRNDREWEEYARNLRSPGVVPSKGIVDGPYQSPGFWAAWVLTGDPD